jgi:hypothetical protein
LKLLPLDASIISEYSLINDSAFEFPKKTTSCFIKTRIKSLKINEDDVLPFE